MRHSDFQRRRLNAARAAIAATAARQHGVIATRQIRALGLSSAWITRAAARGHLIRVHRGVYAVGHPCLTLHGRWMAAVLACGSDALLSHHAAAAIHELRSAPGGPIDVTAPVRRRHAGIRTHTARRPDSGTGVDAIPVTTLERTLLDYAAISNRRRLDAALDAAERSGRLNPQRIYETVTAARGHPGAARLTTALRERGDEVPWTQSDLEREVFGLVCEANLPKPQCNVFVDGILVDFYWPHADLIVEVDSYGYHRSRPRFESDRHNDTIHTLAGRQTIRPTYNRIQHDRAALQADLSRLIAAGLRERSDP